VTDAVQRLERIIMSPEWAQSKPNHHPCPSSCSHGSGSEVHAAVCVEIDRLEILAVEGMPWGYPYVATKMMMLAGLSDGA
jgi:hypothetical protein